MSDEITSLKDRVLVTGASGFIGARLVEELSTANDYAVTALVRSTRKVDLVKSQSVTTVVADLSSRQGINQAIKGHDIVINLAYDFKGSQRNNLQAFTNLHDACIEHGVKHFIQVSSIVVYDDWSFGDINEKSSSQRSGDEYRDTKIAIEQALDLSSAKGVLHTTILQPTIVYGPNSWLWTDAVVEKLLTGTLILPSSGKGVCNAVYVDDVVDALLLAIRSSEVSDEKYIISGPEPVTWGYFFESYNQALGTNTIQYVDFETLSVEQSGMMGKIKKIIANPLSLANWKPVQIFLNVIEKLLGSGGIERLKSWVKRLKKSCGTIVYYPNEGEVKLYSSTGVCSIAKAKEKLAYAPTRDFNSGFEITKRYIAEKYSSDLVSRGPQ